jgi:uncharacterized protein
VTRPPAALVVLAKAPEPGRVKTRLCPPATPEQAAELAAAALLDTLDAVAAVPGAASVVVLTGRMLRAARATELAAALQRTHVLPQRGDGLGRRIWAAHADTAVLLPGRPTLQLGMDTPQVGAALLTRCLERLDDPGTDAVLGPATDGGWWALGLRDPRAAALVVDVPTSRDDTGARTVAALRDGGLRVGLLPELTDVDTAADAVAVAAAAPAGRFAAATARCRAFGAVV